MYKPATLTIANRIDNENRIILFGTPKYEFIDRHSGFSQTYLYS